MAAAIQCGRSGIKAADPGAAWPASDNLQNWAFADGGSVRDLLYGWMNDTVTQRQTGSVERILGKRIHRHHHGVALGTEAPGLGELRSVRSRRRVFAFARLSSVDVSLTPRSALCVKKR